MASTSLSRTPSSAGNRKTFTISLWTKLSNISTARKVFINAGTATPFTNDAQTELQYRDNQIKFGGGADNILITTALYRDVSAWYHIVLSVDTTQATASDRLKLYVNGEQVTAFATANYPSQNDNYAFNNNVIHYIGSNLDGASSFFDGNMAHFNSIDGTAYPASTFGETDSLTGIWVPKTSPSVTYGTNGFFLKFASSGSMGTDSSGNSNNFTVNGNLTQTQDTPSNVFATLNPLHFGSDVGTVTMSNGNLTFSNSGSDSWRPSTQAVSSGKYYAEFKTTGVTGAGGVGINSGALTGYTGSGAYDYVYLGNGIVYNNDNNQGGTFASFSTNDIIGVAVDLDNNKIYFSINGTFQNSADPTSGATGTGAIAVADPSSNGTGFYHFSVGDAGSGTVSFQANFGNGFFGTTAVASAQNPDDGIGIFEHDVPTGYRALCTKSINAQEYS